MPETTQLYEYRGGVLVPVPSAISECVAQLRDPASEFTQAVKSIVSAAIAAGGGGGAAGANGVGGFYPPIRYGRKWLDENAPECVMRTYAGLAIPETIDPNGQSFTLEMVGKRNGTESGGTEFTLLHSSAVFINDAGEEIDLVEKGFVSVTASSNDSITIEFKDVVTGTASSDSTSYYALDYPWGSPIRVEVVGNPIVHALWGNNGIASFQAITRYASPPLGWVV